MLRRAGLARQVLVLALRFGFASNDSRLCPCRLRWAARVASNCTKRLSG